MENKIHVRNHQPDIVYDILIGLIPVGLIPVAKTYHEWVVNLPGFLILLLPSEIVMFPKPD